MKIDMLGYLNGDADPATTAWLDRVFSATDDLRGAVGVERRDGLPTDRAIEAIRRLWHGLLRITVDTGHHCLHVTRCVPTPMWIVPDLGMAYCESCWYDDVGPNVLDTLAGGLPLDSSYGAKQCDLCRVHFKDASKLTSEQRQFLHFTAVLRFCRECRDLINESEPRPVFEVGD